jgi:DNA-directed RNA polymerase specialized sigma24 family protein
VIENPTDAQLVEAARTGDSFAITLLWQRHLSVAWTAARAASGRRDAEPVVVRTAERLIAELGDGRGPSGATRPHLLALVRDAVAEEESVADAATGTGAPAAPLALAPVETYRDLLPDGIGDGTAVAGAYTSLPTRWQEALWLAEVDGLPAAEIAAELGLTAEAVESTLADARSALRTEWASLRLAGLPVDAPCRAAGSPQGRRARAHLDECAGCRAVSAPPEAVSRRALATMPLLLLGAGGGIAFLESVRKGASADATEPVPSIAETAADAAAADALSADAVAAESPATNAFGRSVALPVALMAAIRHSPRRHVAAVGAALAGVAATTAIVATLVAWNGGTGDGSTFIVADPGASADVAEPAPQLLTPEVVATDVPDEPGSPPPSTAPDAAPDAAPETDAQAGADEAADAGDAPSDGAAPQPDGDATGDGNGAGNGPGDGTQSIVAPRPPVAVDRAPLDAELGRPGANGWRTLDVTGEPNASFTVSSGSEMLFAGALDSNGSAALQVRGTGGDVESLTLAYGTGGGTSSTAAAQSAPSDETARRGRTSSPTPGP